MSPTRRRGLLARRLAHRDERGFTLVEVLAAMIVFAIAATAVTTMFAAGLRASLMTKMDTTAKNLSQQRFEQVRNLPFHIDQVSSGTNPPDLLDTYYVALDALLTPAVEPGPGEAVFIVTTPGRAGEAAGGRLAARGDAFRAGPSVSATDTDVAATVLYALGLPISRTLAGHPLVNLFTESFARQYPVRYVATYGPPRIGAAERTGQPLDQEMIDRLRSLGYVR